MEDISPKRTYAEMQDSVMMESDQVSSRRHQSPFAPQLQDSDQSDRCDSPRSNVAQHMETLNLRHDMHFDANMSPSPRKRNKSRDSVLDNEQGTLLPWQGNHSPRTKRQLYVRDRSSSPSPQQAPNRRHDELPKNDDRPTASQECSSPLSPDPVPSNSSVADFIDPSVSEDLTWHFSEITGMNIDVSAGDDGEGINGIGFRPTPQTAMLRRQRRKQQVNAWKMREAQEARQKRFEKRQACRLSSSSASDVPSRAVRFAEML